VPGLDRADGGGGSSTPAQIEIRYASTARLGYVAFRPASSRFGSSLVTWRAVDRRARARMDIFFNMFGAVGVSDVDVCRLLLMIGAVLALVLYHAVRRRA
jgi:hypothetical protein